MERVGVGILACPEGLEPPTYCLEGNCSIRLSYGQLVQPRCRIIPGRGACSGNAAMAMWPNRWNLMKKWLQRAL